MKDYHLPVAVTIPAAIGLVGVLWLLHRKTSSNEAGKKNIMTHPKGSECVRIDEKAEQQVKCVETEGVRVSKRKIPETLAHDQDSSDVRLKEFNAGSNVEADEVRWLRPVVEKLNVDSGGCRQDFDEVDIHCEGGILESVDITPSDESGIHVSVDITPSDASGIHKTIGIIPCDKSDIIEYVDFTPCDESGIYESVDITSCCESSIFEPVDNISYSESDILEPTDNISNGESGILEPADNISNGESGILEPADNISNGESSILEPTDNISNGESGILEPADNVSNGESGILEPADNSSNGESGILEPTDDISNGESGILEPADNISNGESGILEPADNVSNGESVILEPTDNISDGESGVLEPADNSSNGESGVLEPADNSSNGDSGVLEPADNSSNGESGVLELTDNLSNDTSGVLELTDNSPDDASGVLELTDNSSDDASGVLEQPNNTEIILTQERHDNFQTPADSQIGCETHVITQDGQDGCQRSVISQQYQLGTLRSLNVDYNKDDGLNSSQSKDDGLNSSQSKDDGLNSSQSKDDSLSSSQSKDDGLSTSQSKDDGLNSSQSKDDSLSSSQSKDDGLNSSQSKDDGLNSSQSKDDGLNSSQSKDDGLSSSQSKDDGLNTSQSKDDGLNSSQSKDDSLSSSQSKDDGLNSSQSKDDGLNSSQSKDDGLNSSQSKDDGLNSSQSKDDGLNSSQSKDDGLNSSQSKDDSLSSSQSKDDGLSTSQSKDDGLNSSQSKDDSLSSSQSKDDGLSTSQSKDDGLNSSQSKDDSSNSSQSKDDSANSSQSKEDGSDSSQSKDNGQSSSQSKDDGQSSSQSKDDGQSSSQSKDDGLNSSLRAYLEQQIITAMENGLKEAHRKISQLIRISESTLQVFPDSDCRDLPFTAHPSADLIKEEKILTHKTASADLATSVNLYLRLDVGLTDDTTLINLPSDGTSNDIQTLPLLLKGVGVDLVESSVLEDKNRKDAALQEVTELLLQGGSNSSLPLSLNSSSVAGVQLVSHGNICSFSEKNCSPTVISGNDDQLKNGDFFGNVLSKSSSCMSSDSSSFRVSENAASRINRTSVSSIQSLSSERDESRPSVRWLPKASSSSIDSFGPDEIEAIWGLSSSMDYLDKELFFMDNDPVELPLKTQDLVDSCTDPGTRQEDGQPIMSLLQEKNKSKVDDNLQDTNFQLSSTAAQTFPDKNLSADSIAKSISPMGDNSSEGSNDSGRGGSEHDMIFLGNDALVHFDFNIPSEICGQFIGKRGKNINYLKSKTGAQVTLTNNFMTAGFQVCQVSGTQVEVDDALNMIRQKFPLQDYPLLTMAPINIPVSVPLQPDSQIVFPEVMQLSLPEGVSVDVFVSAVVDAGQVFVQQPTHRSFMSLEKLNYFLNLVYTQDPNVPSVPLPIESGVICVCESEGFWYRAMIMSPEDENGDVQVKFVDYGGYVTVPVAALKQIRADFMNLPFQAVECFMANITPNQNEKLFSSEATQALSDMTQGKLLQCQVVARTEYGVPYIHLYQINSENRSAYPGLVSLPEEIARESQSKPTDGNQGIKEKETSLDKH